MDFPDGERLLPPLKSEGRGGCEGLRASISIVFEAATKFAGVACAPAKADHENRQLSAIEEEERTARLGMDIVGAKKRAPKR